MTEPTSAEVRRLYRRVTETGIERPWPDMTDRIARIVTLVMNTPLDDVADALTREFPDMTAAEMHAAGTVMERHGERQAQDGADLKTLGAALRPYFTDKGDTMSAAFARWSAAHPEADA